MAADLGSIAKAIEGFRGGLAGQKGHETLDAHLARAHAEAVRGRASGTDSPGKREAYQAAGQREIPSERAHDGGDGNVKTNKEAGDAMALQGKFGGRSESPGVLSPKDNSEDRQITGAAGVHTGGNFRSNHLQHQGPSGQVSFRTVAAGKGAIREPSKTSGGNARSNPPGPPAPSEGRVGDAPSPVKAGADTNSGGNEKQPGYVAKEGLGADQWEKAADKLRQRLVGAKK